ncbi:MAG: MBL fold metallo-hydrolase [Chloroflexota bacterium]|nr:MBL fold metallo-hydrolase [Chloroflexota bacterium]
MTKQRFTQLTPSLWVTQSALYATNSGIFLSEGQAGLIDPGIAPEAIAGIARFVTEQGATPQATVLTHCHWDHLLGAEHFPGIAIIAHTAYYDVLQARGDALQRQVATWETDADIHRQQPFALPRPTLTFDNDMTLSVGALKLRLSHAPGHAPDQLVITHAASGVLWAGDMLSDLEIPLISHNLAAYERTLARLAELDVRVLIPGHGQPTDDPAEIRARLATDRAYLAEIHTRVTQAVAQGKSVAETVALCDDMTFRHPAENRGPHRLNVESAYLELGGETDPTEAGWSQVWNE